LVASFAAGVGGLALERMTALHAGALIATFGAMRPRVAARSSVSNASLAAMEAAACRREGLVPVRAVASRGAVPTCRHSSFPYVGRPVTVERARSWSRRSPRAFARLATEISGTLGVNRGIFWFSSYQSAERALQGNFPPACLLHPGGRGGRRPPAYTERTPMSEPYLGLLIGAAPDLPQLFESQSEDLEWMVMQTSSLTVALNCLRRRPFHVVIAEHHQASGAGNELVAAIREVQPGVKVIVIESVPSDADVIEAMQQKAFSYFSRPFDPTAVRDVIYSAVTDLGCDDGITVLSAEPDFLTLRIRCNIPTADRLQHFFEELKSDLDPEERGGVAMAFREMLLNAIEHGGKLDPNEWVRVSRVRSHRSLVYHMEDPGAGFSRSALEHAAVANSDESPLDHVKIREEKGMRMGGFGMLIAQRLFDEVIYNQKGNEVFLVKHLD